MDSRSIPRFGFDYFGFVLTIAVDYTVIYCYKWFLEQYNTIHADQDSSPVAIEWNLIALTTWLQPNLLKVVTFPSFHDNMILAWFVSRSCSLVRIIRSEHTAFVDCVEQDSNPNIVYKALSITYLSKRFMPFIGIWVCTAKIFFAFI